MLFTLKPLHGVSKWAPKKEALRNQSYWGLTVSWDWASSILTSCVCNHTGESGTLLARGSDVSAFQPVPAFLHPGPLQRRIIRFVSVDCLHLSLALQNWDVNFFYFLMWFSIISEGGFFSLPLLITEWVPLNSLSLLLLSFTPNWSGPEQALQTKGNY